MQEIEKMKEASKITDERNRLLSEKMFKTIDQLNQKATTSNLAKKSAAVGSANVKDVKSYDDISLFHLQSLYACKIS